MVSWLFMCGVIFVLQHLTLTSIHQQLFNFEIIFNLSKKKVIK